MQWPFGLGFGDLGLGLLGSKASGSGKKGLRRTEPSVYTSNPNSESSKNKQSWNLKDRLDEKPVLCSAFLKKLYLHSCMCVGVCVCVHVCMYACVIHACMHACMYVCMHACNVMHACMLHVAQLLTKALAHEKKPSSTGCPLVQVLANTRFRGLGLRVQGCSVEVKGYRGPV